MTPDWQREKPRRTWDPPRQLVRSIRRYQSSGPLLKRWWVLQHRFWSVVAGADIPINCVFGGGFHIPHPVGIVIHPDVRIGANCQIMQNVTLGSNRGGGPPVIGDGVDIGPGARLLGPISVGDNATIGANAVVLRDVPAGATVAGIPARPIGEQGGRHSEA